jgi:hypothetical protein
MKTMTIESENPELLAPTDPQAAASCLDIDPDQIVIEAAGGPLDGGGGSHSGPTPPPTC